MRTRLLIIDAEGNPIIGMDGAHGDEHATAVITQNMAALRAGGLDPIAVEFDVFEGGAQVVDDVRHLGEIRVEVRTLPDGRREVSGVARRNATGVRSIARALRVIDGPADIANPRSQLHRRPRGDAA